MAKYSDGLSNRKFQVKQIEVLMESLLSHLHPDFKSSFVPLPPTDTVLDIDQLKSFFGGDFSALHELIRLARTIAETRLMD